MPEGFRSFEMTPEEYLVARTELLEELGLSYEDLAEQARRWNFDSPRHRMAWDVIRDE